MAVKSEVMVMVEGWVVRVFGMGGLIPCVGVESE